MTYSLIAGNLVVYLCLLPLGPDSVLAQFGLSPSYVSAMYVLTSMFVHISPIHLVWNMLFLWLFGQNVEDVLGRTKYLCLYVASGFVAALLHSYIVTTFIPSAANIPVVGASGAIAGILGFFAVRFYRTGIRVFWWIPFRYGIFTISAMFGLGIWFAQQFAGGVLSVVSQLYSSSNWLIVASHKLFPEVVAYWSHIGGMAFGVMIAYFMGMALEGKKEYLMIDAEASLEQGTTWHAAEHLTTILNYDPENADVHASLGRTYALQEDADLAVAHYRKCIELYLVTNNRNKAINAFIELRSFYRNAQLDLATEFHLARHMEEIGRFEPALQLFKEISLEYPGTPEAEVALMKIGNIYLSRMDNPKESILYFEKFLKDYPSSSWRPMVLKSLTEAHGKQ